MKRHYKIFRLILIVFISCSFHFANAQTNEQKAFVKVEGEVTTPLSLYAGDLSKMKRMDASLKDRDGKVYTYSGVPISEILKQAGVTIGKDLRGENLSKYLLAKAADGYEVLFSLAELDSSFTDNIIILADQMEGKSIPEGKGPFRIIVPGDKKPARCIFEVTHLVIRYAKQ